MTYKYIFFDLDGTLTDPAEGITHAVARAFEGVGYPVPAQKELLRYIGPPLLDAFREFCGMSESEAARALVLFREYYTQIGIHENRLLPYARELLVSLRAAGYLTVLATSKPEEQAAAVLADFEIAPLFDLVAGSTPDQSRAKKSDIITYALNLLGAPAPEECLMVGDRFYDVEGARACGMDSVGVLCGYGSEAEFTAAGALAVFSDLAALAKYLLA